ncbi:MAG: Hpt domain-containing protein [Desulfobacteraceae bacterium]|jgi:HPt (histidine-containing phosphotransfer) domain-containing protein
MDFEIPAQKLGLEVDEYLELIELFIETGGNDLKGLEDAIANNDVLAVVERSHSLKGASGNLGITEIYEKAKDIEDRARYNSLDGIEETIKEIKLHLNDIIFSVES